MYPNGILLCRSLTREPLHQFIESMSMKPCAKQHRAPSWRSGRRGGGRSLPAPRGCPVVPPAVMRAEYTGWSENL